MRDTGIFDLIIPLFLAGSPLTIKLDIYEKASPDPFIEYVFLYHWIQQSAHQKAILKKKAPLNNFPPL